MKLILKLTIANIALFAIACGKNKDGKKDGSDGELAECLTDIQLSKVRDELRTENGMKLHNALNAIKVSEANMQEQLLFGRDQEIVPASLVLKEKGQAEIHDSNKPLETGKTYQILEVKDDYPANAKGFAYRKLRAYDYVSVLDKIDNPYKEDVTYTLDHYGSIVRKIKILKTKLVEGPNSIEVKACGYELIEDSVAPPFSSGLQLFFHDGNYSIGETMTVKVHFKELDVTYLEQNQEDK